MSNAPNPIPVDPNDEPEVMRPSATGLIVPDAAEEALLDSGAEQVGTFEEHALLEGPNSL